MQLKVIKIGHIPHYKALNMRIFCNPSLTFFLILWSKGICRLLIFNLIRLDIPPSIHITMWQYYMLDPKVLTNFKLRWLLFQKIDVTFDLLPCFLFSFSKRVVNWYDIVFDTSLPKTDFSKRSVSETSKISFPFFSFQVFLLFSEIY